MAESHSPVSRPLVSHDRRKRIIDAFITLVAERGLEDVKLADIAAASGVQQTNIRHFIGNRDDLIVAVIHDLMRRYEEGFAEMSKGEPDIAMMLRLFFGLREEYSAEDRAYQLLEREAARNPATRGLIKHGWALTLGALEEALRRSYPRASTADIRDTAYIVACMAETNTALQELGYPRARARSAEKAARILVERLADEQ